jgi:hypothetical protein
MDKLELDSFADDPLWAVQIGGGFDSAEQVPSNRGIASSFSSDLWVSVETMHMEGKPDVVKVKRLTKTTEEKNIQIMATGQKPAPCMFI